MNRSDVEAIRARAEAATPVVNSEHVLHRVPALCTALLAAWDRVAELEARIAAIGRIEPMDEEHSEGFNDCLWVVRHALALEAHNRA